MLQELYKYSFRSNPTLVPIHSGGVTGCRYLDTLKKKPEHLKQNKIPQWTTNKYSSLCNHHSFFLWPCAGLSSVLLALASFLAAGSVECFPETARCIESHTPPKKIAHVRFSKGMNGSDIPSRMEDNYKRRYVF